MKKVIALLAVVMLTMTACVSKETPDAGNSNTETISETSGTTNETTATSVSETSETKEETTASVTSSEETSAVSLTGNPKEVLEKLVADTKEKIEADGGFYYMTMTTEITADTSVGFIGFSADNYNKYVTAAFSSKAAIGSQAHEIILIKCKDADSAKEVKSLIKRDPDPDQKDGGYASKKWICVSPEESAVVDSGDYVLIAASTVAIVDATIDVFKSEMGDVGEVDVFYESTEGEGEVLIAG